MSRWDSGTVFVILFVLLVALMVPGAVWVSGHAALALPRWTVYTADGGRAECRALEWRGPVVLCEQVRGSWRVIPVAGVERVRLVEAAP